MSMHADTIKTAVRVEIIPVWIKRGINPVFTVFANESNKLLDVQIIECIVPIMAERMERWTMTRIHFCWGKILLSTSEIGISGLVKYPKGIESMIEPTNNK